MGRSLLDGHSRAKLSRCCLQTHHPRQDGGVKKDELVATWRTVQKLDADAWRKLRDDAPYRFTRWLCAVGIVIGAWDVLGTPERISAWLPVAGLVLLLLLPDASSIAFAGIRFQARQAADLAAQEAIGKIELQVTVARETGVAAADSALAESAPPEPAGRALSGLP